MQLVPFLAEQQVRGAWGGGRVFLRLEGQGHAAGAFLAEQQVRGVCTGGGGGLCRVCGKPASSSLAGAMWLWLLKQLASSCLCWHACVALRQRLGCAWVGRVTCTQGQVECI
jgi:hypothetical protein